MKNNMTKYLSILTPILLQACSTDPRFTITYPSPTKDYVVRGTATVTIGSDQNDLTTSLLENLFLPEARATSTDTVIVTYNNASSVTFTVSTTNFVAGSYSGLSLNLGDFVITALKDTDPEQCGPSNNAPCNNAYLQVYTTGTIQGFVNTTYSPNYGVPVYTSGLNPAVQVPLDSPGININEVLAMPATKYVVNLVDFTGSTTYTVKTDFTNGGYGSYSMTYVIQYALSL